MPDKIKITKEELKELYEIVDKDKVVEEVETTEEELEELMVKKDKELKEQVEQEEGITFGE